MPRLHRPRKLARTLVALALALPGAASAQDLFIRDNVFDDGSVPSLLGSASPDVRVRNDGDCSGETTEVPVPGTPTTVCATVRNRDAAAPLTDVALSLWWTSVESPSFPTDYQLFATAVIGTLAPLEEVTVAAAWRPPVDPGSVKLALAGEAAEDPFDSGPDTVVPSNLPRNNNNLAETGFFMTECACVGYPVLEGLPPAFCLDLEPNETSFYTLGYSQVFAVLADVSPLGCRLASPFFPDVVRRELTDFESNACRTVIRRWVEVQGGACIP